MILRQIGPHETEVQFNNGVLILFSYTGPVAAYKPGLGALRTSKFHSRTSARHMRDWFTGHGWLTVTEVPQEFIDNIVGSA
jgi:hypothetical protein